MIIAAIILGSAAVITVAANLHSSQKIMEMESDWARQHLLSIGCEYFLLWGHEAPEPGHLLPQDYQLSCELHLSEEPNGNDKNFNSKDLVLQRFIPAEYIVRLYYKDREIARQSVKKLIPEHLVQ